LPQKHEKTFDKWQVDINDPKFGKWVEKHQHRQDDHRYNDEWKKKINSYEEAGKVPTGRS